VASQRCGGKGGGGRPDMAQAGGPDGAKAGAALSAIEKAHGQRIGNGGDSLRAINARSRPDLRDRSTNCSNTISCPIRPARASPSLIVCIIVIDVLAMILSSVAEFDAVSDAVHRRQGRRGVGVCAGIRGTALERGRPLAAKTVAGAGPHRLCPLSLGIIDLLAFLPASIALIAGQRSLLMLFGVLPFFKLVRYSPAMRSLLAALHAERRTLVGCLVILTGAVLVFASLLYAIEHDAQPEKFGTIPAAMWWAIVTLGTVGYGDVVPVTPLASWCRCSPLSAA
jgi:voltage-gated potassium channel